YGGCPFWRNALFLKVIIPVQPVFINQYLHIVNFFSRAPAPLPNRPGKNRGLPSGFRFYP
ncbi:hypothetical protein, partial [Cronobacter sakazakii]|uniref:hypothetical protein n=1 Tax=Cronobacter sakazakii TaxID=28141 RepID=UPI00195A54DC